MKKIKIKKFSVYVKYFIVFIFFLLPFIFNISFLEQHFSKDNYIKPENIFLINIFRVSLIVCGFLIIFSKHILVYYKKRISNLKIESKIFILLMAIILFLVFFHLITFNTMFFNYFNLDYEYNLPTWFSTIQLFFISFLLLLIYAIKYKTGHKEYFWIFWFVFFLLLSIDEFTQIHESLEWFLGVSSYALPIIFIALLVAAILILKKSIILNPQIHLMFLGISLIFLGAVGFDMLGIFLKSEHLILYNLEAIIEEVLEFLGEAILIYSLIGYINTMKLIKIK